MNLYRLIAEAQALAGDNPCSVQGHTWASIGSRGCPHPDDIGEEMCGQAVYECTICAAVDYGEAGGPGANDCAQFCKFC